MDNLSEFIPMGLRAVVFTIAAAGLIFITKELGREYDMVYISVINEHSVKGADINE